MAQHQCPNCGGYNSYNWRTDWALTTLVIFPITMLVLLAAAGFSSDATLILLGIGGLFGIFKIIEYLAGPRKAYVCRLCEFNWNLSETPQKIVPKPDLIAKGNALLERQAAEAAAAEEERYQQEQRRRYGQL